MCRYIQGFSEWPTANLARMRNSDQTSDRFNHYLPETIPEKTLTERWAKSQMSYPSKCLASTGGDALLSSPLSPISLSLSLSFPFKCEPASVCPTCKVQCSFANQSTLWVLAVKEFQHASDMNDTATQTRRFKWRVLRVGKSLSSISNALSGWLPVYFRPMAMRLPLSSPLWLAGADESRKRDEKREKNTAISQFAISNWWAELVPMFVATSTLQFPTAKSAVIPPNCSNGRYRIDDE